MKNYINYYYNLFPDYIHQENKYFYFFYNNEKYFLFISERLYSELIVLFELNLAMLKRNILVHQMLLNKDKQIITLIDNIPYILMKVYVDEKKVVTLSDINYINVNINNYSVNNIALLNRSNWIKLWSDKIDYLEYQITQIGRKYPLLRESFSYFIGLAENAISYIKNTYIDFNINEYNNLVVSHRRINDNYTLLENNNPINFVLDSRVRDFSEYIKFNFFHSNKNLWNEIYYYLRYNNLSVLEYRLLYGRLLFPSFYFDIYENILNNIVDEKEILKIINKIDAYERFLAQFNSYIKLNGNIPEITWLKLK